MTFWEMMDEEVRKGVEAQWASQQEGSGFDFQPRRFSALSLSARFSGSKDTSLSC